MPLQSCLLSRGFLLLKELYNWPSKLWYVRREALCHWLITSSLSHGVNEAEITALTDRRASLLWGVVLSNALALQRMDSTLLSIFTESLLCANQCVVWLRDSETARNKQKSEIVFCLHHLVGETDAFTNSYTTKRIMLSTIIEAQSVVGNQKTKINSNPWGLWMDRHEFITPRGQQLTTYVIITVG